MAIWKPIRELIALWEVVFFPTQRSSEMTTSCTSACETTLPNRCAVSVSAVAAGQYSVSVTSSGQLGHCAKPSSLHSGKLYVLPTMRFLVVLSITMSKISLSELPKSKMYQNWIGRPAFLIGKRFTD